MPWDLRRLLPNHTWTSRAGCLTMVLDRGAVQFDYPRSWSAQPGAGSIALFDRTPPKGNRLEVSCLRLPAVDWSGLPIVELVDQVTSKPRRNATPGPLREEFRRGIELALRDLTFAPPQPWLASQAMCFRVCMARYGGVHCLITYEFRRADGARCEDAWDVVLETLVLDRVIADPLAGPLS